MKHIKKSVQTLNQAREKYRDRDEETENERERERENYKIIVHKEHMIKLTGHKLLYTMHK